MSYQDFRTDRCDLKPTNLNPNWSVRKTLTRISKSQGLSIQIHNIHGYKDCTSIYDNRRAHHWGELGNAFQMSLFGFTFDHNRPDRIRPQIRLVQSVNQTVVVRCCILTVQVHVDDNDSSFGYDPQHSRLLPNIKWSRVVKPLNEPVGSFWNLGGAISPFPPRFGSLAGRLGIGWIWHDSFRLNPFWTVYPKISG